MRNTSTKAKKKNAKKTGTSLPKEADILKDYALACLSRELSLLGRKEVFMGRAKFGIFGDGKEVPQLVMARHFAKGDWRSGYYRDQTLMFALGELTAQQFFAQLYAHSDPKAEPASSGRMMTAHFGTRLLDSKGKWQPSAELKNSSADISPTAGQMPRLLGLAYASKLYRELPELQGTHSKYFSKNGNEIAWGTIGDAATSEGHFFETLNAAGVLQVPMVVSVWDDGYGISVDATYHTVKQSISAAMAGFSANKTQKGLNIYAVKGWDYASLFQTYQEASTAARSDHTPSLIHVEELTQPQGHSTSGSHTRYKSKTRLKWEEEYDCLARLRCWIIEQGIGTAPQLQEIEQRAQAEAKNARDKAWQSYSEELSEVATTSRKKLQQLQNNIQGPTAKALQSLRIGTPPPLVSETLATLKQALYLSRGTASQPRSELQSQLQTLNQRYQQRYNSYLYSHSSAAGNDTSEEAPKYSADSPEVDGREVLQACFDALLARDGRVFVIGEDVGRIGDVNQGLAGLQEKYGPLRLTDTSIREATIAGQGIGAAMRGLRPLVEIQYLDYMLFALQTLSDDLASLHYRSGGTQKAPLVVRTRGHRLEGIWHSGSPIGMLLHALRGIHLLVPRNMTQAAAFYNTLFAKDEPALLIECLNGYRLKEKMPENVGSMSLPLGKPEILRPGTDLSLVTYGSMCRIALQAAEELAEMRVSLEVIDLQTLLPFDTFGVVKASVAKTNRLLVVDEDVPGGASAYILQQLVDAQRCYELLDAPPRTVSAQPHRPAYGSDGNYFSKPNKEDIIEAAYALLSEDAPDSYPPIYT